MNVNDGCFTEEATEIPEKEKTSSRMFANRKKSANFMISDFATLLVLSLAGLVAAEFRRASL